jgi:hypothetical protein
MKTGARLFSFEDSRDCLFGFEKVFRKPRGFLCVEFLARENVYVNRRRGIQRVYCNAGSGDELHCRQAGQVSCASVIMPENRLSMTLHAYFPAHALEKSVDTRFRKQPRVAAVQV